MRTNRSVDDPSSAEIQKLATAIDAADKISYNPTEVQEAKSKLALVNGRIEARKRLREGTEDSLEEVIKRAMKLASEVKISDSDETIQKAKTELARISEERLVEDVIKKVLSLPPGPVTLPSARKSLVPNTDMVNKRMTATMERMSMLVGAKFYAGITIAITGETTISPQAQKDLQEVYTRAVKFGCKTPTGKILVKTAAKVLEVRETIKKDNTPTWDLVEKVLIKSPDIIETPELSAARSQLILRAKINDVAIHLKEAAAAYDIEALELYVEKGDNLNMDVKYYRDVLNYIIDAIEAVDQIILRKEIERAEEYNYPHQDLYDAKDLLKKLDALEGELKRELDLVLSREQLQALYDKCKKIGMHTNDVSALRNILKLSEEEFVTLQFKTAERLNDTPRAIKHSIRLKDLFFARHGYQFIWTQAPLLKKPEEYAKGLLLFKDDTATGMMTWTKYPIHTSLTRELGTTKEATKLYQKTAVQMFKNIIFGFVLES